MSQSQTRATTRAVTFPNKDGHLLFGVVHEPPRPRSDVAVIILSAGVKARVGPHRLYAGLADAFVQAGIRVLRFDFHGLGDSEGTIDEPLMADLYGSVSLGRYVDDTRASAQWACEHLGVKRVVLAGLCGGAITGLMAGADDPRVAGLLGLGAPVSVDGSNIDKMKQMSIGQLEGIRGKYFRKLLSPQAWLRVLSFKTDFRLLAHSLSAPLRTRKPQPPSTSQTLASAETAAPDNTNPYFLPAMLKMVAGRKPALLLFSEADRLYWEFRERFVDTRRLRIDEAPDTLEVAIVKDANHIFSFSEWEQDMLQRSRAWIEKHFPMPARS
jgi:pimeloyl-ACP methyl ester carboxylesterase